MYGHFHTSIGSCNRVASESIAALDQGSGNAFSETSMLLTCAATVNLSWASFRHASPLIPFQFSIRQRLIASLSFPAKVRMPLGTVARSVVSEGSSTNSPTSGVTKSFGPPELAPITGVLQAMHSTNTRPKGSLNDGKHPALDTV